MTARLTAAIFLAAFAASGPLRADNSLDGVIEARDLICEFNTTGAPASRLRRMVEGERYDMLMVIEAMKSGASSAKATSSRQAGTKRVRVYKTASAVHFVQDLSESVVVTSVTGCQKWGRKGGEKYCARYRALNSWHFDTTVHRDPDAAFARLKTSSYNGTCEPWYLNGVTTERDREALRLTGRSAPPELPSALQASQDLDMGDDAARQR